MVVMMGVGGMLVVGVSGVPVRMSVPIPQQPGAGEIGQQPDDGDGNGLVIVDRHR